MINGENSNTNSSNSAIACPDPLDEFSPWFDRKSDVNDSPDPSSYSSCEESEFERYCSANSVIGTASLCSSVGTCNEFLGSDFGSVRNFGFGRNSGSRNVVGTSDSLDCLSDGGIEFIEENVGFGNQVILLGESPLEDRNGNKSVPSSDVNSSWFRANYEENGDESSTQLGVRSGLKSLRSHDENFESYRGVCEENDDKSVTPLRVGSDSDMLPTSAKNSNGISMSQVGGNGSPSLPVENYSSYEANSNMDMSLLSDGNGLCLLPGCGENYLSGIDTCDDNNMESRIEYVHNGSGFCDQQLISGECVQTDGREYGTIQETDEETSSRYEHSDAEQSMLDYGTDDEDRACRYECRNLQYLKGTKLKNENLLLMNSVVAFGSDDWDEFMQETGGNNMAPLVLEKPLLQQQEHLETEKIHVATFDASLISHVDSLSLEGTEQEEHVRDIPIASYQVLGINESADNVNSYLVGNFSVKEIPTQKPQTVTLYIDKSFDASESHLSIKDDADEREVQCICSEERVGCNEEGILKTELLCVSDLPLDPLSDSKVGQLCSSAAEAFQDKELGFCEDHKPSAPLPLAGNSHNISLSKAAKDSATSVHLHEECLAPDEVDKLESDEFYDEMVHEMEEILLDSGRPHGAQFSYSSQRSLSKLSQSFRDGSSTASTSGADYPPIPCPLKIDRVEVVGAKQKRGDVSFGERLVGVKEYTVYVIRVWGSKDQWEVVRRYRDFFALYRQLKTLFTNHGCSLPPPWSRVDRESRKMFGNASPNVVSERSILIQDCIRSILHGSPFSTPSSVVWFLSPCTSRSNSSTMNTMVPQSMQKLAKDDKSTLSLCGETCSESASALGKTISLLIEIKPRKSVEQLLEAQYYTCSGCHKHLDVRNSRMQELVQTFGWGKPRLCEYTGQLFCASCHTNDTAVLPARVLHFWNFSLYSVSQLAKAYLESIYDQPMLCVSAVNPFLFSKVPALLHVMGIRKKIGAMFPYLRCPFRRSLQRGLGSRRYLLENSEFFALRDLVDLSKGAFSALPVMIETVSMRILEHITQQCLVCCDVGIPCGARQACEDPSSLIFPFQEAQVTRCSFCESVFHKPCFGKLMNCPCGTLTEVGVRLSPTEQEKHGDRNETDEVLDTLAGKSVSKSAVGFFSDLRRPRHSSPVILMSSLPSTAL